MQTQTGRMIVVTVASAALIAAATPPAEAHHRPNLYCSESGDICQSTRKTDGVRKLSIVMAAKYLDSFKLCVRSAITVCERFRVRSLDNALYGRRVNWKRHFPVFTEHSTHTVWWRAGGTRIGRRLGFHVR